MLAKKLFCHFSPVRFLLTFALSAFGFLVPLMPAVALPDVALSGTDSVGQAVATIQELRSKIQSATLSNGIRVLFYRRGIAPVFAGTVAVKVGGVDEQPGLSGLAHMLEHMAFKGTPEIGTKDFAKEKVLLAELESLVQKNNGNPAQDQRYSELIKELEKLWLTESFSQDYETMGASGLNATTDKEMTMYFLSLPRSAFEFWCQRESERILRPVMRQFYQERDVVREERRMRYEDDPGGKLYEVLLANAFTVHPYQRPVIGYADDIARLTASEAAKLHRDFYVPENIVIALVGDIDPEKDLPIVEKYFGVIPARKSPARNLPVEPEPISEKKIFVLDRAEPELLIGYPKPVFPDKIDAPLSVGLEAIAGGRISPLIKELVIEKQLAQSISQSEGPGFGSPNLVMFSIVPRSPHTAEAVLAAFDRSLGRILKNGVKPELIEMAKRRTAVDYVSDLRSNQGLGRTLTSSTILYNDWSAVLEWFDQAMKTTPEAINEVMTKYLQANRRTVVILKKQGSR